MPYLDTRIRHLLREAREDKGEGEAINRYKTVRLFPPPDHKLMALDWGEGKYKYKFRPLPRQNDPIIREILRLIHSLNVEHIKVADMRFRVSPTDKSSPFWLALPDYTTYCSKLYTFMDDYNEFPLTAWVNFSPGMAGPTEESLYVKIGTKWVLLKEWLLSSYQPVRRFSDRIGLVGEKGYKAQRKWWKLNGKHFRLFDLAAEVRMTIFEFALGPRIYPLTEAYGSLVCLGVGFPNCLEWSHVRRTPSSGLFGGQPHTVTGCSAYEPNVALLSVSRQTRIEALQAGWENTRKCFFSPTQFGLVLRATIKPKYNWLNHLILDFTMEGWFDLLDLKTEPYCHKGANYKSFGTLLSKLDKLTTLQLWFRSPDDGSSFYPSGTVVRNDDDGSLTCCQRTMVDCIMTFAWPCVKDLRAKVIVGGILKKDTKDKWNAVLAMSAEDKHRVIDQEAAEQAILHTPPALLANPCSCRTPCTVRCDDRQESIWNLPRDELSPRDLFNCEDNKDKDDAGISEDVEKVESQDDSDEDAT